VYPWRGIADERVLAAMGKVERHLFVPEPFTGRSYDDSALPIAKGQTISQPYTVAVMTEALTITPGDKILEIGTGSGYQAAILAELGQKSIPSNGIWISSPAPGSSSNDWDTESLQKGGTGRWGGRSTRRSRGSLSLRGRLTSPSRSCISSPRGKDRHSRWRHGCAEPRRCHPARGEIRPPRDHRVQVRPACRKMGW